MENKWLVLNGNKGRKFYKHEAIFIINCCTTPNVVYIHLVGQQNNYVEHLAQQHILGFVIGPYNYILVRKDICN
jgi:hypothetical protein